MRNAFSCLHLLILVLLTSTAIAQSRPSPDPKIVESQISKSSSQEPATLKLWNREIVVFRHEFNHADPQERVGNATKRILSLPEVSPKWDVEGIDITLANTPLKAIYANGTFLFAIQPSDVDTTSGETLDALSKKTGRNLQEFLEARTKQRKLPLIIRGIISSLIATLIAVILFFLLSKLTRRLVRYLNHRAQAVTGKLRGKGLDLRPQFFLFQKALLKIIILALVWTLANLWLTYVFKQFPYTEPWSNILDHFLIGLLKTMGLGFLHALPGLITVVVIFFLARFFTRFIGNFFQNVQSGKISFFWLYPETAGATQRLIQVMIWIFALVVAYPYIPGSETDAFKGVSVFIGLMVSLGSAGFVNQVMSGLVVIYSRAFRKGDYVKIGESEGFISDVGILSTRMNTRKREEIVIPNAVLVGNQTVNFSRLADGKSVIVSTQVTIGYDAPWRQVHAMLEQAATQVKDICKSPRPFIQQRALGDFYVEYHLFVYVEKPENRWFTLSELHGAIQDVFNENGVQIMSPHFKSQPDEAIVVPKEDWRKPIKGKSD